MLTRVSHMISLQPLIPICPSGDVSKRTTAVVMDTSSWACVHPFPPLDATFSPIQNNEPFRNSTQGSRPSGVLSSPDFLACSPLLKLPLAPELPGHWKNQSSVGQVWPLFQQDKLARGILPKSPECKRSTLCSFPGCLACLMSWMAG